MERFTSFLEEHLISLNASWLWIRILRICFPIYTKQIKTCPWVMMYQCDFTALQSLYVRWESVKKVL